jgi:hypothetical protein
MKLLLFLVTIIAFLHVSPVSLETANQKICQENGEWMFTITDTSPDLIEVIWQGEKTVMVGRSEVVGNTSYYNIAYDTDLLVDDAGAIVELNGDENISFNLVCQKPSATHVVSLKARSGYPDIVVIVCLVAVAITFALLIGYAILKFLV